MFAALVSALAAQPLVLSLVPADAPNAPSGEITVELIALNRGAAEVPFTAPAVLSARLSSGGRTWPVELRAIDLEPATDAVRPGGFVAHSYRFRVPAGGTEQGLLEAQLTGFKPVRGVIDLPTSPANQVALARTDAAAPTPPAEASSRTVSKPATSFARATTAASAIERTFANRLAPHEPIYFIYGPHAPAAKFQFSFKYKLLSFSDLGDSSMARTLQFAFTQRSLWDIEDVSSPFFDTSYMPEVMFESLAPKPEERDTWFTWLGYQAGYKHESNGRAGPVSRSLNTVYVRPVVAFGHLDGWHLFVIPELFAYIDNLEDNVDLKDYRGYGRLTLIFGRNDGPSLMMSAWAGREFEHRTVQLDLTVPIRTKLLDFETYLLLQYFNGYGESLLAYREKSEAVRAGISFVR